MGVHLHCKSFSHFFNKKYWHISDINVWNFNETLTNVIVSFEQSGPDLSLKSNGVTLQKSCLMKFYGEIENSAQKYHQKYILPWVLQSWIIGILG